MKIWKKTACLALCTVMSMSVFAGCDENNGNSETARREKAQASAKKYVDTVSDTLETVKSFSVSGKVTLNVKDEYFAEGTTTVDPELTEEQKTFFYLDVTVTQDGENNVAMSMTAKSEQIEIEFGETEIVYQAVMEMIVKDGYGYGREYYVSSDMTDAEKEEAKGLWQKEEITMPEEMPPVDEAFLNSLLGAKEIKEFSAQLLGGAQDIIAEKFFNDEVADGKVSFTKNFAGDVNETLAFIESIDESKDTLGTVINRVLAKIDPSITVESIIATAKEYKDKTVALALTEIDAELAKKDTSLQAVYDEIVNSEVLNLILTEAGMPAEYFAQMKALKIDSVKAAYATLTLGELINMLVETANGAEGGDAVETTTTEEETVPTDYAGEAITTVEAMLGATLEQLEIEMPDCSAVYMNDLSIDTGLQLNAAGDGLETLYLSVDLDVRAGYYFGNYDENDVYTEVLAGYQYSVLSADLTISSFSESTVTINAPADDQIYTPSFE